MSAEPSEMEQAHRAVTLLLQAARIDPVLVEAVRAVDRYLHDVEGENDRLRAVLAELVPDLLNHADGNVGDGCWDLHDKWSARLDQAPHAGRSES